MNIDNLINLFRNDSLYNSVSYNFYSKVYQGIPDKRLGYYSRIKSGNFFFIIEPVLINKFYGENLLGNNYSRSGISGDFVNAGILYLKEDVQFHMGRSPFNMGESKTNSIIQNINSSTFENIILRMYSSNNYFEILHGQLQSMQNVSEDRIKRFIGGHKLSWSIGNKTNVSIGEQVVYTGKNRSLELSYLNPFIPYFFSALNGEEEANSGKGNNDNSMIFASFRHSFNLDISIFGEFIIDDYQVDQTNAENATGFKIGFEGKKVFKKNEFNWLLELVKIDPWTYLHSGEFSSWQNKKHSIGYPFGPDCEAIQIELSLNNYHQFGIYFNFYHLKHGSNSFGTAWNNVGTSSNKNFYQKYNFLEICVQKYYSTSILELGWSSIPYFNSISFNEKHYTKEGSFFLRAVININQKGIFK